ncbi:MAG: SDR family oxidoreductase, partial [Bacilli bacterium]
MKNNKWVLITGANKGLGKEIASLFGSNGYNLILTSKSHQKELDDFSSYLEHNYVIEVLTVVGDFLKDDPFNDLHQLLLSKKICLDTVILNAALTNDSFFEDKTRETFLNVLNVNLVSPFLLVKMLLPFIAKTGNIVLVSSNNGLDCYYKESLEYDASKAGLINIGHNLSTICAPIRVNTICPGWMNTKENASLLGDFKKKEEASIILKRFADPKEVAEVIFFVASSKASYVNDAVIRVD